MNDDINEDLIICRCEEVTKGEICKAIAQGAATIAGVKKRTRAGMGFCQGRTCEGLIAQILSEQTGKKREEFSPATKRPPVRAINFSILEQLGEQRS